MFDTDLAFSRILKYHLNLTLGHGVCRGCRSAELISRPVGASPNSISTVGRSATLIPTPVHLLRRIFGVTPEPIPVDVA